MGAGRKREKEGARRNGGERGPEETRGRERAAVGGRRIGEGEAPGEFGRSRPGRGGRGPRGAERGELPGPARERAGWEGL